MQWIDDIAKESCKKKKNLWKWAEKKHAQLNINCIVLDSIQYWNNWSQESNGENIMNN